jgi:hypothetical protein
MQTASPQDGLRRAVFIGLVVMLVAGVGTVVALVPMGPHSGISTTTSSSSSQTSSSSSSHTGGCIGIAAVLPSVAVTDYKGYDIWLIPFSGILCPGQNANPTYAFVRTGTPIITGQGFNSGAIIQGGFASIAAAEAVIDSGGLSGFSGSIQGLQLRFGLNATVLHSGQSLQLTVSEFNTLATSNNVSASTDWAAIVALTACPNTSSEPFGVALYSGHVEAKNLSQAARLDIFPRVPCPMFMRLIEGYNFQPQSDVATILPGSGASAMAANVTISKLYPSGQPQPLPTGIYTAVAADEWGATVFLYFKVV